MRNPRVSVILTAWNRPEMLKRAVDSVLAQTFEDFEVLLIDDNSPRQEQHEYLASITDPRVRIIVTGVREEDRYKRVRYAVAANIGLELARGEFVTYLCDDDYYLPERLARMVAFFDANLEKFCVYGNQQEIEFLPDGTTKDRGIRASDAVLKNPDCVVDHSSVMHRYSAYQMVGGWETGPEHWGHADGVYWKKLGDAGLIFQPLGGDPTDVHVHHSNSFREREARGDRSI